MIREIDRRLFSKAQAPDCYVFNTNLVEELDDGLCEHCMKYLTTDCEHIDEFVEEIDELEEQ
jgi:hypothetical protein